MDDDKKKSTRWTTAGKVAGVVIGTGAFMRFMRLTRSVAWTRSSKWGYDATVEALARMRGKPEQEQRSDEDAEVEGTRDDAHDREKIGNEVEAFEEACERLEVTPEQLNERREDLLFQAGAFRVMAYLTVLAGLWGVFDAGSIGWLLLVLANTAGLATLFF